MYQQVIIDQEKVKLEGHISAGANPKGWVIFVHGSGSSRFSPRNNWVAKELNKKGYGTFLFDLLTSEEDDIYQNRFSVTLLATRLLLATSWFMNQTFYNGEPVAYFGASTGAGAALVAEAMAPETWPFFAIISRGGRPDLADDFLNRVKAPVLLLVGSRDHDVIKLNQNAEEKLDVCKLSLVEGASHLFEEPGTLDEVVLLTVTWLDLHLPLQEELTWTH